MTVTDAMRCDHCGDELDPVAAEEVAARPFKERWWEWVLCSHCRGRGLVPSRECTRPMTAERAYGAICLDCLEAM
jgi:hypothetical protein